MTTPQPVAVNLQHWPGRGTPHVPKAGPRPDRLGDRASLVLAVAAERGASVERLGLGVALGIFGESVTDAWLIVPDGRPEVAEELAPWATANQIDTPAGSRPFRVISASKFFDYRAGPFTTTVYGGRGWLVGANLGRVLGLIAECWAPARGRFEGGWRFYPPTWSDVVDRPGRGPTVQPVSPHRPPIRAKSVGALGTLIEFSLPPRGMGKRDADGRAFRGHFLDVLAGAFALDGVDSDHLADHLGAFGLPEVEMPTAVTMGSAGADQLTAVVQAVHALALRIDTGAARWCGGWLDPGRLTSPGSVAAGLLEGAGVLPPLVKFARPDHEALGRWAAAHHGGWLTSELAGAGPFPAVDIDQTAGYVQSAVFVGWWRYMTASHIREQDVTAAFSRFLESPDLAAQVLDPSTWRHWGLTLLELEPNGHELPLDVHGEISGRSTLRPVHSPMALPYAWPDAVLTTLRNGRPPKIVKATRLVAVGRQRGLRRRFPLVPGLVLGIGDDPAVALVRWRHALKVSGEDGRAATQLRVVVNALVYGLAARLDQQPDGTERPGPWCWPPLATTVTAGTRLLVGVAELLIDEQVQR